MAGTDPYMIIHQRQHARRAARAAPAGSPPPRWMAVPGRRRRQRLQAARLAAGAKLIAQRVRLGRAARRRSPIRPATYLALARHPGGPPRSRHPDRRLDLDELASRTRRWRSRSEVFGSSHDEMPMPDGTLLHPEARRKGPRRRLRRDITDADDVDAVRVGRRLEPPLPRRRSWARRRACRSDIPGNVGRAIVDPRGRDLAILKPNPTMSSEPDGTSPRGSPRQIEDRHHGLSVARFAMDRPAATIYNCYAWEAQHQPHRPARRSSARLSASTTGWWRRPRRPGRQLQAPPPSASARWSLIARTARSTSSRTSRGMSLSASATATTSSPACTVDFWLEGDLQASVSAAWSSGRSPRHAGQLRKRRTTASPETQYAARRRS